MVVVAAEVAVEVVVEVVAGVVLFDELSPPELSPLPPSSELVLLPVLVLVVLFPPELPLPPSPSPSPLPVLLEGVPD